MSSVQTRSHLSVAEYLEAERKAETKSEYLDGEVFAMSGASFRHNVIVANLIGELRQQLKGRQCTVAPGDLRVHIPATGLYTYPDVVAICGEPRFEDQELDTLLNPTLIIEVLSPTTEAYDRGKKFEPTERSNPSQSTCSSLRTLPGSSSTSGRREEAGCSPPHRGSTAG